MNAPDVAKSLSNLAAKRASTGASGQDVDPVGPHLWLPTADGGWCLTVSVETFRAPRGEVHEVHRAALGRQLRAIRAARQADERVIAVGGRVACLAKLQGVVRHDADRLRRVREVDECDPRRNTVMGLGSGNPRNVRVARRRSVLRHPSRRFPKPAGASANTDTNGGIHSIDNGRSCQEKGRDPSGGRPNLEQSSD